MNLRQWTLAFTLGLAVCSLAPGQPTNPDAGKKVADLVAKLGSSSYAKREQARKTLEALGPSLALEPLRRAKRTDDAETNRRIDELIRLFEEQVLAQQILAPKVVHLKLKEVSVQQAIADLASLSGYPIQFQGDATVFADKKINLDTGKTSFWQALDQLCEQAGLMERIDLTPPAPNQVMPNKGKKMRAVLVDPQPAASGPIVLVNRGDHKSVVSYAGAVKTEVRVSRTPAKAWDLLFIVSAEPRLLNGNVAGRPLMQKMLDSQSKKLAESSAPNTDAKDTPIWEGTEGQPQRRITGIRVKEGEAGARQLKELAGKLTLQVDLQNETLARIANVMEAGGKSATGANGGTLKVLSAKKLGNGAIEIQVALENLTPNSFGGNVIINGGNVIIRGNVNIRAMVIGPNGVQINGGGNQRDLPDLVDAKGEKYKIGSVGGDNFNFVNGSSSRTVTVVYQAKQGQAEPRELVLFGTRTHTIAVPFRFENLPLP